MTFIPEVDDLRQRLETMGLVLVSEGMLDDKVSTGTYSMPANKTFSKRNTILEKRDQVNLQGAVCLTGCGFDSGVAPPSPSDCTVVYNTLYSSAVQFNIDPSTSRFRNSSISWVLLRGQTDKCLVGFDEQAMWCMRDTETVQPL